MKKLLITTVALCFLTLGTYAQSNEVMVIKSADGGAGDPSYRLSCSITDSFFEAGCAHVRATCTDGPNITVKLTAIVCVESLIDPGNGNGLTDEMILFDLDYSFVATNEPINIDEINTLKNKSIMIENDFIIDDEEMHAIIKEGTYGVTNGKMITLVSEVVE